jgi:hypothetical protein
MGKAIPEVLQDPYGQCEYGQLRDRAEWRAEIKMLPCPPENGRSSHGLSSGRQN